MALWERKHILIWGKTRPELSRHHKETVCTGGVFADTKRFVRLYPIPLRFLDDEAVFKKYQWIEADVRKAARDARPESYNIRCDTITVGETIPTDKGDWSRRAAWITEPPGHIFQSVEALQSVREKDGTSIGMVKPLELTDFLAEPYPEAERNEFWAKYRSILEQQDLPFDTQEERTVQMLPPPELRFQLKFRCDDPACTKGHCFSVFDWEVDALYNRLRRQGGTANEARDKVLDKLRGDVCGAGKDTYFFLGNIAAHPNRFTIVGLWYPKQQAHRQRGLFDDLVVGN
jgi:hypothetical protein